MVRTLDSQVSDPTFKNHWVAPRSTQRFIFPRSIKRVPKIPEELGVKSRLSPRSCSATLRQLNPIHKKEP